jgi:signal transduction histidine kinase
MNLFDNAVKYSRFGTRVEVKQWIQADTKWAIITVRSVPDRQLTSTDFKRLFEMGFRGDNAKAIIASGTGLGLYICRFLMETRMRGSISVQADKDGILFTIKMPEGETE